jgi:hypothetical protein
MIRNDTVNVIYKYSRSPYMLISIVLAKIFQSDLVALKNTFILVSNSPRYIQIWVKFACLAGMCRFVNLLRVHEQYYSAHSDKAISFVLYVWQIYSMKNQRFASSCIFGESAQFHSAHLVMAHSFMSRTVFNAGAQFHSLYSPKSPK